MEVRASLLNQTISIQYHLAATTLLQKQFIQLRQSRPLLFTIETFASSTARGEIDRSGTSSPAVSIAPSDSDSDDFTEGVCLPSRKSSFIESFLNHLL